MAAVRRAANLAPVTPCLRVLCLWRPGPPSGDDVDLDTAHATAVKVLDSMADRPERRPGGP